MDRRVSPGDRVQVDNQNHQFRHRYGYVIRTADEGRKAWVQLDYHGAMTRIGERLIYFVAADLRIVTRRPKWVVSSVELTQIEQERLQEENEGGSEGSGNKEGGNQGGGEGEEGSSESSESSASSETIPGPTTITGVACQPSGANVTWDAVDEATSYVIQHTTNVGLTGFVQVAVVSAPLVAYLHLGANLSGLNAYRIACRNDAGDSDWSDVVSETCSLL